MNARDAVITALNETCGLMERSSLVKKLHSNQDFDLVELDIDSLSSYEVIMQIEDALGVDLEPSIVLSSKTFSELLRNVEALARLR
jgi:acyl carrier protein